MVDTVERLARRGGLIELLRAPAALLYLAVALRTRLYDARLLPRARVEVPVISVGNLTAGGTGKTPFVIWLCEELLRRGLRPGVLARGYGRAEGESLNDEGKLFAQRLPDVPQVQDPDRVQGAAELLRLGVDVIVLDDGFQHRRLARDLDFVLVDATRPYGLPARNGAPVAALLPRGLLREPPRALGRADAVVITRSDALAPESLAQLALELYDHAPGQPCITTSHRPAALRSLGGEPAPLGELAGLRVLPVCAIGNPAAFVRTLQDLGARTLEPLCFPDHHVYTQADLDAVHPPEGATVVTTAKDAVKLEALRVPFPIRVLDIELEVREGHSVLEALLDSLPDPPPRRERAALHVGLSG